MECPDDLEAYQCEWADEADGELAGYSGGLVWTDEEIGRPRRVRSHKSVDIDEIERIEDAGIRDCVRIETPDLRHTMCQPWTDVHRDRDWDDLRDHTLREQTTDIDDLDPDAFEDYVARLWERRGWETAVTTGTRDRGVDVRARRDWPYTETEAIQAKKYSNTTLRSHEVQQYAALRKQEDVDKVVIVSAGDVTDPARDRADELGVKIVDRDRLTEMGLRYS